MALTVGGVTIPLAQLDEATPVHVRGDYARTADGTPVDLSLGTKRFWRFTTTVLSSSNFGTVRAAIAELGEQTIAGDILSITAGYTLLGGTARDRDTGLRTITGEIWEA